MSINKFFCEVSAFLFQNVFIALLFIILVGIIYALFIRKASNITKIIYFLLVIEIASGGIIVRWLLGKEDPESDIMIDSYYLGFAEFLTLIALLVSGVMDLIGGMKPKKKTKKKEIKVEPKEVKTITKEEALALASKDKEEEKPKKSLTINDKWMADIEILKKAKEEKEKSKEEKEEKVEKAKVVKKKASTTKKTTTKKTTAKKTTKKPVSKK